MSSPPLLILLAAAAVSDGEPPVLDRLSEPATLTDASPRSSAGFRMVR